MTHSAISIRIQVVNGRKAPEEGTLVGYGALIRHYNLPVPYPTILSLITDGTKNYEKDNWKLYRERYAFDDELYRHLVFALKYEGVNLLVFKKLFEKIGASVITEILQLEPTGQYSRKIWFLYEWLMDNQLNISDLKTGNLVPLLDEKLQYATQGVSSSRHKIVNNLPGVQNFCPLISKTDKLEKHIKSNLSEQKNTFLQKVRKDLLQRASAYLLLKDSKASFTIEGEKPRSNRAARWGNVIRQAGANELDINELNRLQQIVIENTRFTKMGIREQQGFIGDRDEVSQDPIPDHISAKHQDLDQLMSGFVETKNTLFESQIDPVLAAAKLAFGFVFIHPFEDGNGRLHRYIIHHILAKMDSSKQGVIFPVSAAILDHINDYRNVLENYSRPLLDHIDWTPSADHNVEIHNETIDYYRYFDATHQAEFLYDCVEDTITNIIPREVDYLQKYDEYKTYLENTYEMPDNLISLLANFLRQNEGKLSKRALKKEFSDLKEGEVKDLEDIYHEIFND
ncbi:MAG: Fic family protein [Parvicellaceae bacterium]|jgi:Fic family protein